MWYNDTIEGTYTNLTIARQTLLDDPLYGTLLGLEGLSITNSTQDWHDFADDIESELLNSTYLKAFTINYFHDIYDEDITNTFENSLQDIGMVLNKTNPTGANPYGDWKLTGLESVFDKLIYGLGPYSDHMECFFMSWPIPRPEWGYWDAYYTTVSYYYKPWAMWFDISETWNYGHTSDAAHSKMVHSLYLKEPTERQKTYNDIVEWHIQEEFPNMYICQMEVGYAASRKFFVDWSWGIFNFGYVGIGPGIPTGAEFIPGFPTFALLGFMSVSLFAMVYIVMKKRKLN
jgi:hypothetical protein